MKVTRGATLMKRSAPWSPSERVAAAASAVILLYALFSSLQFALQDDVRYLLTRIGDDAAYYMTIARNVAAGRGLTFDGIHPTNGVHPLWLMSLVPLFLLRGTPEVMIRLVALLQTILLSLAYLVFLRTQARLFSAPAATVSALLFVPLVFLPSINGMESAVLVLSLVLLYGYGWHISRSGLDWRRAAVLGLSLGFVLLARLDMIFLPLALLGWAAAQFRVREIHERTVALVAVCGFATCAVVAPYLAFNYWKFGGIMPISGALKSSFPHLALSADTIPRIASMGIVSLACAALAIGRALWSVAVPRAAERAGTGYYATATTVLAWAVTLHFLFNLLFMKSGTFSWYFLWYRLFAIVLISGPLDRTVRSTAIVTRPALYAVMAGILLVGIVVRDQTRDRFPQQGGWHTAAYDAAVWAREHTAPEAVFAMSDCGHFAFFSTRQVINLDGLVNNMDFQRVLAQHELGRYLRENRVAFLVQHAVHNRSDVIEGRYDSLELRFPSARFEGFGDNVLVRKRDEVYRSARFVDGPYPSVLVMWSLRESPVGRGCSPEQQGKPCRTLATPQVRRSAASESVRAS